MLHGCTMIQQCAFHVSFARYCPFCTFCDLVFLFSNYLERGYNGVRALVIAGVIARSPSYRGGYRGGYRAITSYRVGYRVGYRASFYVTPFRFSSQSLRIL